MKLSPREVLSDPRAFLRKFIHSNGIEVLTKGRFLSKRPFSGASSLLGTMMLDYKEQLRSLNSTNKDEKSLRGFSKEDLETAFNEFREETDRALLSQKVAQFKCQSENLKPLEEFVLAVTGEKSPLVVAVLAHWICNIKRKMLGLPVENHLMPVFFGREQGTGKSTAVRMLISPIQDWSEELKLDELEDSRFGYVLAENFVLLFDEMQNAERSAVATLKNKITGRAFACRKLGTNVIDRIENNSSFVGTTNVSIDEQIVDSSGMRRFFQINVAPRDNWNWSIINKLDYVELYSGVDENICGSYIAPFIEELRVSQEALVGICPFQEYISDTGIEDRSRGEAAVPVGVIYRHYKNWCEENGHKAANSTWFGRKISNLGVESLRTSKKRMYIVGSAAAEAMGYQKRTAA